MLVALLVILCTFVLPASAQNLTQTIRGHVRDAATQAALPYATVTLHPTRTGAVADGEGAFRIDGVPIGRYDVIITYVGYEPRVVPEVLVGTAREVVLSVELRESVVTVGEIIVTHRKRKDRPLDEAAAVSARTFSVEETRRYAGGLDDPTRMASGFAGVTSSSQAQNNAVSVRGNAPRTVQWRLEGVEIPNPNHFAGGNIAGGGFVTIFSSQLLADSGFLTGAFPATYGNALGGVFDIRLRHGNTERREYTFQAGMLGVDFAAEGPIGGLPGSSYLFNYRYSTFGIIYHLIPDVEQVPRYQDLSFKVRVPTDRWGTFSAFGIGALDTVEEPEEPDSTKWKEDWDRVHIQADIDVGAAGLQHSYVIDRNTLVSTTLAMSANGTKNDVHRLDDQLVLQRDELIDSRTGRYTLATSLTRKLGRGASVVSGIVLHRLRYDHTFGAFDDTARAADGALGRYVLAVDEDGAADLYQAYTQARLALARVLELNVGVHVQRFSLADQTSIEPRLSARWDLDSEQSVALGYGLHSQLEEAQLYFIRRERDGQVEQPNRDLEFSKAHHLVLGYQRRLGQNAQLALEAYHQRLFDIPVVPGTSYSILNFTNDYYLDDEFVNEGTAQNTGVDLTLERFLSDGRYWLLTGSLFRSRYKGGDGIERNARFDRGYVLDAIVGREYRFGRGDKESLLGLNARFTAMGGERRHPPDVALSHLVRDLVEDESRAFEDRFDPEYRLDFTVTWRTDRRAYSTVWALQIKSLLSSGSTDGYYYNYRTGEIDELKEHVLVPVLSYKLEF